MHIRSSRCTSGVLALQVSWHSCAGLPTKGGAGHGWSAKCMLGFGHILIRRVLLHLWVTEDHIPIAAVTGVCHVGLGWPWFFHFTGRGSF